MTTKRLFVIMPFGVKSVPHAGGGIIDFDELYRDHLKPAGIRAGWEVLRIDETAKPGRIVDQYIRELAISDLVLGDISVPNANVFYELGVRHSISPGGTILIAHNGTVLPFDLAEQRVIFYVATPHGLGELQNQIVKTLHDHSSNENLSPVYTFLERSGILSSPKLDPISFERDVYAKLDRAKTPDQLIGLWEWLRLQVPLPLAPLPALANRLADHERWEVAASVLRAALIARPDDFELHRQLGWYLGHLGPASDQESLTHLLKALELNPRDPETLGMVGGRLKRLGKFEEAAQHFDRAAEVSQRSIYIEVNRAACRVLAKPKAPTEGLVLYETLRNHILSLNDRPLDEWDEIVLCETFFVAGMDREAKEHLRAALALTTSPKSVLSSARHLELFAKVGFRPELATALVRLMRASIAPGATPSLGAPVKDDNRPTPVFVHVSDIHFGGIMVDGKVIPKHRFFDGVNERPLVDHMVDECKQPGGLKQFEASRLHIVASGDFTYTGNATEFKEALSFLKAFSKTANIPKSRVHLIPGNHDINWSLERSDASQRFDNYLSFVQAFYGVKLASQRFPLIKWPISLSAPRPKAWDLLYICSYPEKSLLLAGLNTCVYESEQHHFGFVGERQLQSLRRIITEGGYARETLKVLMMHHHLHPLPELLKPRGIEIPWLDMSILRDSGLVESYLAELGFDVLLHGHKHKSILREVVLRDASVPPASRQPLVVCGAGSLGCNVLEHSEANQYQIIEIQRMPRAKDAEFLRVTWRMLQLKPGAEWVTTNVFGVLG
jgi:tetratricopeptide (TPR) repeat protein